jgi:hypothetical protein
MRSESFYLFTVLQNVNQNSQSIKRYFRTFAFEIIDNSSDKVIDKFCFEPKIC